MIEIAVGLKGIIEINSYTIFGDFKEGGIHQGGKQSHFWFHAFFTDISEEDIEKEKSKQYWDENIKQFIDPAKLKNHIGKRKSNFIDGNQGEQGNGEAEEDENTADKSEGEEIVDHFENGVATVFDIENIENNMLDGVEQTLGEKDQDHKTYDTKNPPGTDQRLQQRLKRYGSTENVSGLGFVSEAWKQFLPVSNNFLEGFLIRQYISDDRNQEQCKWNGTDKEVKGDGRCIMKYIFLLSQRYDEPPEILILLYCWLLYINKPAKLVINVIPADRYPNTVVQCRQD